jgi:hypothetical protein
MEEEEEEEELEEEEEEELCCWACGTYSYFQVILITS